MKVIQITGITSYNLDGCSLTDFMEEFKDDKFKKDLWEKLYKDYKKCCDNDSFEDYDDVFPTIQYTPLLFKNEESFLSYKEEWNNSYEEDENDCSSTEFIIVED